MWGHTEPNNINEYKSTFSTYKCFKYGSCQTGGSLVLNSKGAPPLAQVFLIWLVALTASGDTFSEHRKIYYLAYTLYLSAINAIFI